MSSSTLVDTLIGAIPAEEGATLVARVGERARISSSAGSIDVGSVPLTAEVIDDLSAQILAPEQMQTLRDTGTVQVEFTAANRAGDFAMLAGSTGDDRWLEVRRRMRPATAVSSAAAPAAPPSEATMAAELLSRFHSKEGRPRTSTASAAAPAAARTAIAPQSEPAPVQSEVAATPSTVATSIPLAATAPEPTVTTQVAVAPAPPAAVPSGSNPDLDVPTNIEFPNANFDLDDLSVPSGFLDEPLPSSPSAEPARAQAAAKPTVAAPKKRGARLSVLLPAAAVLVIGLPAVSWFTWSHYFPTSQVKSAPVSPVIPRPKPAATASLPPARSTAPVAPPQAPQAPAPASAAPTVAAAAPPKAPDAPVSTKSAPTAPPAKEKPVAATARHDTSPRTGFSVQVAAVHARDEADRMAAKLVQQGYSGYVVNGEGAAADFYRVRIGAFPDRQAAEDVAKKIEAGEGIKPWIVKETR